jgi:hypothetical protein
MDHRADLSSGIFSPALQLVPRSPHRFECGAVRWTRSGKYSVTPEVFDSFRILICNGGLLCAGGLQGAVS